MDEAAAVVIASLIAFISAVITSILGSLLAYNKLRTELTAEYKMKFIQKQMDACESLWGILESASMYDGTDRLSYEKNNKIYIRLQIARNLKEELVKNFYSISGLYYSRALRDDLFSVIDFIDEKFLEEFPEGKNEIEISRSTFKDFRHFIHRLISEIRREIGVEDLKAGQDGPLN